MKKIIKYQFIIYGIISMFFIWIILAWFFDNSLVVPSIGEVYHGLIAILKSTRIYLILFNTLWKIIITIFISGIVGILLATLSSRFKWLKDFFKPGLTIIKTMPIVAIILLLFLMIGFSKTPYFITGFVIIPIIYEGTLNGLQQIHKGIKDEIKMLSNPNWQIMRQIYLPITFPYIITSFIQSVGLGIKVMIMAEYMASTNKTFGAEIHRYYTNNDLASVFGLVIIIIVIVVILEVIIERLKNKYENSDI